MPTKDFTKGRRGKKLQYIVCHWGVTNKLSQIDAEVLSPKREMSYHYALSGITVHQYVKEENTAWHSSVFDINCRSIGICINASPTNPYSDRDYETASQLIADIFKRHGKLEIKGHRDFYATACPGNLDFDRIKRRVDELLNPSPSVPSPVPAPVPVVVEPVHIPTIPPEPVVNPEPPIVNPIVNQTPPVVDITPPEVNETPVKPNNPPEDVKPVPVVEQVPEKPAETITEPTGAKLTLWQKIILFIIKWFQK
jgi:hypothetical protein